MSDSESRSKPPRRLFYAVLLIVPLIAAGTAAVVALHLFNLFSHESSLLTAPGKDLFAVTERDPVLLWFNRKNLSITFWHQYGPEARQYPLHTNALGLRGEALADKGSRLRVLALGDSTTFGMGVGNEHAWCSVLQELLDPNRESLEILNAGCIGFSVYQSRKLLDVLGPDLRPDIVLLTAGHNEASDWTNVTDAEVAVSINQSGAYAQYRRLRQELFPELVSAETRPRMTPGEFLDGLLDFVGACNRNGQTCFLLLWPWKQEVFNEQDAGGAVKSYHSLIREAGRRAGVSVLDLAEALRPLGDAAFIPDDNVHVTEAGNRAVAGYVADGLCDALRRGLFDAWQQENAAFVEELLVRRPAVSSYETWPARQQTANSPEAPPCTRLERSNEDLERVRACLAMEKGERVRILALGDSRTGSIDINDNAGWCALLQGHLNPDRGLVEVIDGGCSGASLYDCQKLLDTLPPEQSPDLILLTAGNNDGQCCDNLSDAEADAMNQAPETFAQYDGLRRQLFPAMDFGAKRPRMTPGEFLDGLLDFAAACKRNGQACWFLVWPVTRKYLAEPGVARPSNDYAGLVLEAADRAGIQALDLRRLFPSIAEAVFPFGDGVRALELGHRATGVFVAQKVRDAFQEGSFAQWQEKSMDRVRSLLQAKRPGDARRLLENHLRVARRAVPYELLGDACRELGDEEAAIQAWSLGMMTDPRHAPNFEKADAAVVSRGPDQQALFWRHMIRELKDPTLAARMLGRILGQQGKWVEAAEAYRIAVRSNPGDAVSQADLGLALLKAQDLPAAVDALEKALAINPDIPGLREQLEAGRRVLDGLGATPR